MTELRYYIDAAIENRNLRGYKHLSNELGGSDTMVSQWMNGRGLPSPPHMLVLADFAKVDQKQALVDLALWKADEETKHIWSEIAAHFTSKVATILAVAAIGISHAGEVQAAQSRSISPLPACCSTSGVLMIMENMARVVQRLFFGLIGRSPLRGMLPSG